MEIQFLEDEEFFILSDEEIVFLENEEDEHPLFL